MTKLEFLIANQHQFFKINNIGKYVHYGVHSSAISLPHATKTRLASNIPKFDGDVPFGDFLHVEAYCGDHVLLKLP